MSRPGPHQREPRPYDWQRQFQQPDYQGFRQGRPQPEQSPYQQPYQQPGYPEQPYEQGYQQSYQQPYQEPYQDQSYEPYDSSPYGQQYGAPQPSSYQPSAREMYPDEGGGRKLPGFGLLLSLLGVVVQVLCMLVLPWVSASAAGGKSLTLPQLWDLATQANAQGFGGWYVVLFSYPLAALGIVLAIVSVLEWVAGKVIFGILAILGIGWLLLRYGVAPAAGLFGETAGFDFNRQEITAIGIAVAALALVLIMLKTGLAMFRRIAGVILLVIAGVHIYAVRDLFDGAAGLSFAAYGPALGYALSGIAALIGPRRLSPA